MGVKVNFLPNNPHNHRILFRLVRAECYFLTGACIQRSCFVLWTRATVPTHGQAHNEIARVKFISEMSLFVESFSNICSIVWFRPSQIYTPQIFIEQEHGHYFIQLRTWLLSRFMSFLLSLFRFVV